MEIIHRLPFILGACMALLFGMIGFFTGSSHYEIYIKMGIGLVVFFCVGIFIINIVIEAFEKLEEKKAAERLAIEEEAAREREMELNAQTMKGQTLDYAIDDGEILPYQVSGAISRNLD